MDTIQNRQKLLFQAGAVKGAVEMEWSFLYNLNIGNSKKEG